MPAFDSIIIRKLKPGISTAREVRERMGPPSMEWLDDDGTQTWEYARTPNGIVNYMFDFSADARLQGIRQVLAPDYFGRVHEGMTFDQIRRLLGKPAHVYHFPRLKEHVWDWKTPTNASGEEFFNVHFNEAGLVVRTSTNFTPRH